MLYKNTNKRNILYPTVKQSVIGKLSFIFKLNLFIKIKSSSVESKLCFQTETSF